MPDRFDYPVSKDATEIELEKFIFGDDANFHEELRSNKRDATVRDSLFSATVRNEISERPEHDGLETIADTDVGWIATLKFSSERAEARTSFSSSIPVHLCAGI